MYKSGCSAGEQYIARGCFQEFSCEFKRIGEAGDATSRAWGGGGTKNQKRPRPSLEWLMNGYEVHIQ
jgi:hypothetical protein